MNGIYVCARCRARTYFLARCRSNLTSIRRSSFVSLSQTSPRSENSTGSTIDEDPSLELPDRVALQFGRPKYRPRRESRDATDGALQSLFKASVREAGPLRHTSEARLKTLFPSSIPIRQLQQSLSDPQCSVETLWRLLENSIGKRRVMNPGSSLNRAAVGSEEKHICKALLQRTIEAWMEGTHLQRIPSPSRALIKLHKLQVIGPEEWTDTLWAMLRHHEANTRSPKEATRRDTETMLQSISEVWNNIFCIFGRRERQKTLPIRQKHVFFPNNEQFDSFESESEVSKNFINQFLYFTPTLGSSKVGPSFSFAAYATYDLLQNYVSQDNNHFASTKPREFLRFMSNLLQNTNISLDPLKDFLTSTGLSSEYVAQLLERAAKGPQKLVRPLVTNAEMIDGNEPALNRQNEMLVVDISNIKKRLNRAAEKRDLVRIDALWQHLSNRKCFDSRTTAEEGDTVSSPPSKLHQPRGPQIPHAIYTRFMSVYMSLRQPDRAINVWNAMITDGHTPSIVAWHAMIEGCRTARDADSLEEIWHRMMSSGIQPDVLCWTSRVSGLMNCNKREAGIKALFEMGHRWLEAAHRARRAERSSFKSSFLDLENTGDVDGVVKPSIETVNAALGPLLAQRQDKMATEVLFWAQSFNIRHDIVTFNTLLRRAVRDGQDEEIEKLLDRMDEQNILPDVATITILVDGLFQNKTFLASSPTEQEQSIAMVLRDMEASGVHANIFSYGTLIDRLLKQCKNLAAARGVLDHMAVRKVKASPHIYTIILTHYFDQETPDLVAIDSLWEQIQLERGVVDLIFYDRLIEGYARIGQISKMMAVLSRMPSEGKVPGWNALSAVLQALIRSEEWDTAKRVIQDVESENGCFKHGIRGHKGEASFWDLVKSIRPDGDGAADPVVTAGQGQEKPL